MKRREMLERLLELILDQRNEHVFDGREKAYLEALETVFGPPVACLLCGQPKTRRVNDLDAWFCQAHCPVCNH